MDIVKIKETTVFDTDKLKVDDIILYRNKDNIENFVGKVATVSEFELKIHKLVRSTAIGVTDTIRPNEIESGDVVITKLVPENKTKPEFGGCDIRDSMVKNQKAALEYLHDRRIQGNTLDLLYWIIGDNHLSLFELTEKGTLEVFRAYIDDVLNGRKLGESDE